MSHEQLTGEERDVLAEFWHRGLAQREIARRLGRSPSTISRELRRHSTADGYHAWAAQAKATARRRGRPPRKMDDPATAAAVKDALRQDHSPELIDGRLALLDGAVRIGRQTIYNWITAERNKGRKWHRYLPRRGKPCRSRKSGTARYRGQKPIGERPAVVAQRRRLGDWEGDTLEGRKGGMAVLTLVERRSRRTMLCRLPDRSGEALHTAVAARFTAADDLPRRTLTVDQGREFADGEALAQSFGGAVYCTDPHSPWQKGTVEQTNGLLRRYLPKGFDGVSDRELTLAEDRLNHRPRKCLGFRTPHEVLFGISPA